MKIRDEPNSLHEQLIPVVAHAVERKTTAGKHYYWDHASLVELYEDLIGMGYPIWGDVQRICTGYTLDLVGRRHKSIPLTTKKKHTQLAIY
jgi:hypothetical protein